MSKCIITLPSLTFAQKARKALIASNITVTIVRLSPEQADKGCGWGIETDCSGTAEITRILDISDIPWRRILRG
ncbi:MAG: DUF3343 domain-containing protein [Clostridia bacterium]|nr:DUF3343 domain-containing protein [Clostridia bacterium]